MRSRSFLTRCSLLCLIYGTTTVAWHGQASMFLYLSPAQWHVCLHGCMQIPLAFTVLLDPKLQSDRLYSKDEKSWRLVTTTAGYFLYDLYAHSLRFEFMASLVHAAGALAVFLTGIYCGILHYYGAQPSSTRLSRSVVIQTSEREANLRTPGTLV